MRKIESFEAACELQKLEPGNLPTAPEGSSDEYKQYLTSNHKLRVIRDAIVGDFKSDYSNRMQKKWFPIFVYDASLSAFRFGVAAYAVAVADAGSGARQTFETEEQAIYAGTTFVELYNDILKF